MMLTKLFVNYLIISLSISLVIIVLLVSSPLLRKQYAAKWRFWIWLVLAICLLLPFNFSFEKSLISIQLPSGLETLKTDSVLPDVFPSEQTRTPDSQSMTNTTSQSKTERLIEPIEPMEQSITTSQSVQVQEEETASHTFTLIKLISFIWCTVAVVFWLYHFIGYYLFKNQALRWSSPIVNKHAKDIIKQIIEEMNVKASSIRVLISEKVTNPMLVGFNKPHIFLPHENYSDEQLEFILRHELVHYKRHDIIYKLLLIMVKGIHWFNPLVWIMVRETNREIEICCDDMVVQKQNLTYRKEYCAAILSAMQSDKAPNTALTTSFSGRKNEMKQRFMNVLSIKKKRNGIVPFCTALLLIGAITILTACTSIVNGQSENAKSKQGNISTQSSNGEEKVSKGNEDDIPGLLTKETATIGDIHLGDSKQKVIGLLGDPDKVELNPDNGEKSWYYSKHEATLFFYQESPDTPAGGVVRMIIKGNSDMKTNTGIGIGDSLEKIIAQYPDINGDIAKEGAKTIWINGNNKGAESSDQYYPTIKFELQSNNTISSIELNNRGVNPGPYYQKPLTRADMKIGDVQLGEASKELIEKFGEPSQKTIVHGIGDPEWIYKKQGFSVSLDPVWAIRATSPFSGSTPRGIKIGSTEEEVKTAYPDVFVSDNLLVQNSTDRVYQLVFDMENGVVTAIAMHEDLVLRKY